MVRIDDKRKAISLRLQGCTYAEIKNSLHVSKSTLSNWLSDYQLDPNQLTKLSKRILERRILGIEKIIATKRRHRDKHRQEIYMQEKQSLLPLTKKETYIAGLMLYWGEGTKNWGSTVSLNNTDPRVVRFYYHWLRYSLNIPKNRIKVSLHLYKDMNVSTMIHYWSKELDIPTNQFIKPYIKQSESKNIDHKGYKFGTCGLYVYDVGIKTKIMSAISALSE
jgi:transcriptional regulator with XRE-family HTH domain